ADGGQRAARDGLRVRLAQSLRDRRRRHAVLPGPYSVAALIVFSQRKETHMNVLQCVAVLALVLGVPQADQPPLALTEIDHAAQYLFDSARDSAWTQADEHFRELQRGVQNLPTSVAPADVVDSLRERVTQLGDTVPHRDRVKTMDAANAVTKYAMGLIDAFPSLVPAQLPRLAYLGRQIELSVAAQDQNLY